MAPSRKTARKPRKPLKKKKLEETILASPVKLCSDDSVLKKMGEISTIGCTTPKAQKYKIPTILSCPPAPKKQRLVSSCTLRRTPISFFDPPDIELFFASYLATNHIHTHNADSQPTNASKQHKQKGFSIFGLSEESKSMQHTILKKGEPRVETKT